MDSTLGQRQDFADALTEQLNYISRVELCTLVAKISGESVTPQAVTNWLSGHAEPTRGKVFAIEEALGLRPGALSRHLGYLPVGARTVGSVAESIDADARLGERDRKAMKTLYRVLVS